MLYWLIPLALLVLVALWLLWPKAGVGLLWHSAPGGPLRFRLRLHSPLARVVGIGKTVNNGLSLFGVVHIRLGSVSPSLLAHEVGHVRRATGHWFGYLWRYLTDGEWRRAEEAACWDFATEHQGDAYLQNVARLHVQ